MEISVTEFGMCALTEDGDNYCWGDNEHGGFGTGYKGRTHIPLPTLGGNQWTRYVPGNLHSCGIDVDGEMWCSGGNNLGQIGDGRQIVIAELMPVRGGLLFDRLEVGPDITCGAQQNTGHWYCWGDNRGRQLQNIGAGVIDEPTRLTQWEAQDVSLTQNSACGTRYDSSDSPTHNYCWGSNIYFQLGIGIGHWSRFPPTPVDTTARFESIELNLGHGCGLSTEGDIYCWGKNYHGEVGMNPSLQSPTPRLVDPDYEFVALATGFHHSCGLTDEGQIRCWGNNEAGQLGTGQLNAWRTPSTVIYDHIFVDVGAGNHLTCGLTDEGEILCWGASSFFTGVSGVYAQEPLIFDGEWDNIDLGSNLVCSIKEGDLYCAGWDGLQLLGEKEEFAVAEMTRAELGFSVTEVEITWTHACVLDEQGAAHCIGSDSFGALGIESAVEYIQPVAVVVPE